MKWLAILALVSACGDNWSYPRPGATLCNPLPRVPPVLRPMSDQGFVAHEGGSPAGLDATDNYSESLEAYDASYSNGFRAFEYDFVDLADGTVIVAHDHTEQHYGLSGSFKDMTRADVEGRLWDGKYALLFGEDMIDLLVRHPDTWLLLDTKWDDAKITQAMIDLAPDDSVRDRIVPSIVSEEEAAAVDAMYPFPEKMMSVYRWGGSDGEVVDRMQRHGIDNVMMWWDSRWHESTQATMDTQGYSVWVHTPDDPNVIRGFRERGVGVYSNGWIPCTADP